MVELVEWLRKGAIQREAPLLQALEQAPLPRKAGAPSHNQNLAAAAGWPCSLLLLLSCRLHSTKLCIPLQKPHSHEGMGGHHRGSVAEEHLDSLPLQSMAVMMDKEQLVTLHGKQQTQVIRD